MTYTLEQIKDLYYQSEMLGGLDEFIARYFIQIYDEFHNFVGYIKKP